MNEMVVTTDNVGLIQVEKSATSGMRKITAGNTCYMLVVEVKRELFGKGLTQLLLALKSMWDVNDGQTWKLSELVSVLLGGMEEKEDRWLKNHTQTLDVIYSILSSL